MPLVKNSFVQPLQKTSLIVFKRLFRVSNHFVAHQESFIDVAFFAFHAPEPDPVHILMRHAPPLVFESSTAPVAQKCVVSFNDPQALHCALQVISWLVFRFCHFNLRLRTRLFLGHTSSGQLPIAVRGTWGWGTWGSQRDFWRSTSLPFFHWCRIWHRFRHRRGRFYRLVHLEN